MTERLTLSAAFAVLALGCGSNGTSVTTPTSGSPGGPSVSIVAGASTLTTTAYSPNSQTISRGGSVTFINNDNTSHSATAGGAFDTNLIAPGGRATVTFQNTGSFTYRCSLHSNMTGTIVVQ
jgi:plastocyanin